VSVIGRVSVFHWSFQCLSLVVLVSVTGRVSVIIGLLATCVYDWCFFIQSNSLFFDIINLQL